MNKFNKNNIKLILMLLYTQFINYFHNIFALFKWFFSCTQIINIDTHGTHTLKYFFITLFINTFIQHVNNDEIKYLFDDNIIYEKLGISFYVRDNFKVKHINTILKNKSLIDVYYFINNNRTSYQRNISNYNFIKGIELVNSTFINLRNDECNINKLKSFNAIKCIENYYNVEDGEIEFGNIIKYYLLHNNIIKNKESFEYLRNYNIKVTYEFFDDNTLDFFEESSEHYF